jgi:hypothetical protein
MFSFLAGATFVFDQIFDFVWLSNAFKPVFPLAEALEMPTQFGM